LAAGHADLLDERLEQREPPGGDGNMNAVAGEHAGEVTPEAGRCARDEHNLSGKVREGVRRLQATLVRHPPTCLLPTRTDPATGASELHASTPARPAQGGRDTRRRRCQIRVVHTGECVTGPTELSQGPVWRYRPTWPVAVSRRGERDSMRNPASLIDRMRRSLPEKNRAAPAAADGILP